MKITYATLLSALVILLQATNAFSADADPRAISLACDIVQGKNQALCKYRYAANLGVSNLTVKVGDRPVAISAKEISAYPVEGQTTAILILVDTSDPARKNTVEKKSVNDIVEILAARKAQDKIGIAVFDTDLKVIAPIGSDAQTALNAVNLIKANGQATEFYKSILAAIEVLKKTDATRKGLIIMSDGKDEDRAYKNEDVIKAAKEANIVILGLGYPERPSDTPALQTLKRLADETYGEFINVSGQKLPADFISRPFAFVEGGGQLLFNSDSFHGKQEIAVTFGLKESKSDSKSATVKTTLDFPDTRPLMQQLSDFMAQFWMYVLLGFVALILIIYGIYSLLKSMSSKREAYREFAYLDELNGAGTRYIIDKPAILIGRSQDCDITLSNDSISSRHAEIHRRRDGSFYIVDLASTNGVSVNEEKVNQVVLKNNDLIDLGEVRFTFIVN